MPTHLSLQSQIDVNVTTMVVLVSGRLIHLGRGSPVSGSEGERQQPSPPVLGSWLPSAPFRTRVAGCREASESGRGHQSMGLGYHLPLLGQEPLGPLVSRSKREWPWPPVLGLGYHLRICPLPDKGHWCLEASRSSRRHQSWGLGNHLPLSRQGLLVPGSRREGLSPPI